MQKQRGTETMRSVLEPTIPVDVGVLSQRQRIIDAMIECCAEKAYAATTIADIVSRASISRTTFYKRFEGKRDCFDAALGWCLEEMGAAATASRSPADSPPTVVRKAIAANLELMAARPALAHLVMGEAVTVDPAALRRRRKRLIATIEGLWDEAGEQHEGHSDPRLAIGRAQVLVYNEILAGRVAQLPQLLPDLVYILLLPFAGHDEALSQARLAGNDVAPTLGDE
jgi:AcrR family transcriptional regulator